MDLFQWLTLPEEIDTAAIAEDAIQAAFKVIADRLELDGFPVTGDIGPYESNALLNAFRNYVHGLALNNVEIQKLNCTSDDPTNHQGDTCPVHER